MIRMHGPAPAPSFKEPLAPESCAPLVKSLSALNNAGASQSEEDT